MLSADSALFYDDRAYGHPLPVKGGPWLVVRAGGAREWDGSRFVLSHANQLRGDPLSFLSATKRAALIEPASIQEVPAPFDFADAAWGLQNGLARSDAASVFVGKTASKLTTVGATAAQAIFDTFGAYTGSPETLTLVVERGNHATCAFGLWDATDNDWVQLAGLFFDTGVISEVSGALGTARDRRAMRLLGIGPNGGRLYLARVHASRTAGKSRAAYLYVDTGSVAAGQHVYVHYIGEEEDPFGRYPFEDALLSDQVTAAPVPAGIGFAWNLEFTAGERSNVAAGARVLVQNGDGAVTDPRFLIYQLDAGVGNGIGVVYDDGTTQRALELGAQIVEGDQVRVTGSLAADGVVRAQVRVGALGALVTGTSSSGGLATSWGGTTPRLRLGHASAAGENPCRMWHERLAFLRSSDLLNATDHLAIHNQCRLFRLDPAGRLLRSA